METQNPLNPDCPCKKRSCPRHGDCAACRAYHADGKRPPRCQRHMAGSATVVILTVLAVLGLLGGVVAVVLRAVPVAGICWAAAALGAFAAYDLRKEKKRHDH